MKTQAVRVVIHNPALTRRAGEPQRGRAAAILPAQESPSVRVKLQRLRRELSAWIASGAQLAPREVRAARRAICGACSYWHAAGNLGLGECRYPGCGCTRAKTALATSRCPAKPPKWEAWAC